MKTSTSTSASWVVHKFGGTSVAGADRYRNVWAILDAEKAPARAIVVSAMSGVTDALLELVELARKRDDGYLAKLETLRARHVSTVRELLSAGDAGPVEAVLDEDARSLQEILKGIWHSKHSTELQRELVSGHGEIWSAQIFDAYLRSRGVRSAWLDARQVLVVEPGDRQVSVDWTLSQQKLDGWLGEHPETTLVVTGFIASTPDGLATTLKRNGSDYSASIFGKLLRAASITIWTDVDGVLTADPRLVPDAVVLRELSYAEATELAYFGAKVVHPSTMAPAIEGKIPIWIRNTFRPGTPGTKIHAAATSDRPVRGFATIDRIALFNVEGTGMIGVPGISERLFGSLREVGVSVVMISQASSEHSICFAIPESQAATAKQAVEKAFFAELHHGQIQTIAVIPGSSILAIVGDNMVARAGVAGSFFGALGRAGVNIRAIAQGSSERNISVVIDGAETVKALRAAHSAFYLSPQTLSIGLVGCGRVGAAFLGQLHEASARLKSEYNLDLRVRGILNSKAMALSDSPLDLATWQEALAKRPAPASLDELATHVRAEHLPHSVLIDFTASTDVAKRYPEWLERGLHVITPNKKANTGSLAFYREIEAVARATGRHYLYSTTVGAGLPVLRTLRDLVRTGDRITKIEGVLSGTLSYLLNSFDGTEPFSTLVRKARDAGYTEPDPRDDLSGMDVARKVVILAREIGLSLELSDVPIQSLVPRALESGTPDAFLAGLSAFDGEWAKRLADARKDGKVLRYVGTIDHLGNASVGLRTFPATHPFARLAGTDNIVAFTTARYTPQPLIVQGPGAGPEVTAAGVFADLLRLTAYLGGNP